MNCREGGKGKRWQKGGREKKEKKKKEREGRTPISMSRLLALYDLKKEGRIGERKAGEAPYASLRTW